MDRIRYTGPSKVTDNELSLLQTIITIVEYTDPEFTITICKNPESIICHINPSDTKFRDETVHNLLWINRNLGIRIHFSSSLHISRTISFTIQLDMSPELVSLSPK